MLWVDQNTIKKYGFAYVLGLFVILSLKLFYRYATVEQLDFMLRPTVNWLTYATGIRFEKAPSLGYIHHGYQFLIAAPCAGLNFMTVLFATMFFSYARFMIEKTKIILWLFISMICAYSCTLLVNGLRIVLSIFLPAVTPSWIPSNQSHILIGTLVYTSSLLLCYPWMGKLYQYYKKLLGLPPHGIEPSKQLLSFAQQLRFYRSPLIWYLLLIVGIPLIRMGLGYPVEGLLQYSILVCTVLLANLLLVCRFTQ